MQFNNGGEKFLKKYFKETNNLYFSPMNFQLIILIILKWVRPSIVIWRSTREIEDLGTRITLRPQSTHLDVRIRSNLFLLNKIRCYCLTYKLDIDNLNDYLGLRLRGLPFTIRRDDINSFFTNYNYVKDSVKLGRSQDGMLTGEGAILFPSEDECKIAFQQRNG